MPEATEDLATIIVTVFNQEWVLHETLASVVAQTYRPLECVIVDDGSSDGSSKIIEDFAFKYEHEISVIKVFQANQGAQAARNAGLKASRGSFIQFLDGDDILDANKLRNQIAFLSSPAGQCYDVVYGDARWLHHQADQIFAGDTLGIGPTQDILVDLLRLQAFNPLFSYLCRRTAVERCGGWDSRFRINDDVEYFLRMACSCLAANSNFAYLPGMTGLYRKHQRPRISDGGSLLRTENTFAILKSIEARMERDNLFTPERRSALAHAYRRVSYWASTCDDSIWRESLADALRIDKELLPERMLSRWLQRLLGPWISENILRYLRRLKQLVLPAPDTWQADTPVRWK